MSNEIWVVPFFGQGHLFPCIELCKHLASRNFQATLVISSNLASYVPSSLLQHPLIRIAGIQPAPSPAPGPEQGFHPPHADGNLSQGIQDLLLSPQPGTTDPTRPVCAVVDVMMSWTGDVFKKFGVPMVALFTSGACSAAVDHAAWKSRPLDLKPGETRFLDGLPDSVALTYSDLKRRPHEPPHPPPPHGGGSGFPWPPMGPPPPGPGGEPRWVEEIRDAKALMINTCQDLERPFIDYIAHQTGKPVWGVGPLLPEQYWKNSTGSFLRDGDVRSNRRSSVTEDEVIQWLDSKPRGSVLYVSFGTEVGPTMEEYVKLGKALESSEKPFILVIQPGSGGPGPVRGLLGSDPGPEETVEEGYLADDGGRGLIIRGWAPQLLILGHPSTGGFLSHCGWNSTVEAIGRGVPLLGWPFRGDQFNNAKLVVGHLKVGYIVDCDDMSGTVKKDDVVMGIERLMGGDKEMKERAENLSAKFKSGFPKSSVAALDAFKGYINERLL